MPSKQLQYLIELYLQERPTMTLEEATRRAAQVLSVLDTTRVKQYRQEVRARERIYDFGMSIDEIAGFDTEK